jgi:hypothetical protein
MHLLHHKSWNVYNAEAIAKVKADEKKAHEEEERRSVKARRVEQERRLESLRAKSAISNETSNGPNEIGHEGINELSGSSSTPLTFRQHVDFFSDTITTTNRQPNEEYEEEKRQEQQKRDLQTTVYLVNNSKESNTQKQTAWYEKSHSTRISRQEQDGISANSSIDEQEKQRDDPLNIVKQHFKKLESLNTSSSQQIHSHSTPSLSSTSKVIPNSSHSDNKHHHHSHQQQQRPSPTSIEHLREQRLRREKEERHRLARMYDNSSGGSDKDNNTRSSKRESFDSPVDDRKRPYHSQFHPELARHSSDQSSYHVSKSHRHHRHHHATINRPP